MRHESLQHVNHAPEIDVEDPLQIINAQILDTVKWLHDAGVIHQAVDNAMNLQDVVGNAQYLWCIRHIRDMGADVRMIG